MSGIPIASLSRDRKVAQAVLEALFPDYDGISSSRLDMSCRRRPLMLFIFFSAVVHCCLNSETALAELPLLFAGLSDIKCASGIGSNVPRPAGQRVLPRAILFGDATDEAVAKVTAALTTKEGIQVPVIRVTKMDTILAGSLHATPAVIAKVSRKKLDKAKIKDNM